jgi:hypothetical protein
MINIYWSPYYSIHPQDKDLEIFYGDIEHARKESMDNMNDDLGFNDNFLNCPSFNDLFKNTFLFRNLVEGYAKVENEQIVSGKLDHDSIPFSLIRKNTLKNRVLIKYEMSWILFSDKPLNMSISSPYFHESHNTKFGSIVPGIFDIGSWFRPINLEYSLDKDVNEIYIPPNDPLVYLTFHTDEKIKLSRFQMNEKLMKYALSVMRTRPTGSFAPLKKSYAYFNKTHLRGNILKEIQANLLYPPNNAE